MVRKIVLFIASSLDGFIAREDGGIDWLFSDADYGYTKFFKSVDTVIMGRKTYDLSLTFCAYPYKGKKGYVFTRKPARRQDKNVEFVPDLVTLCKKLIRSPGKNIWLVGGGDIISVLMNAGLVDEIILSTHPIILGKGIPLFRDIKREINLRLVKSIKFDTGLLQAHYVVC